MPRCRHCYISGAIIAALPLDYACYDGCHTCQMPRDDAAICFSRLRLRRCRHFSPCCFCHHHHFSAFTAHRLVIFLLLLPAIARLSLPFAIHFRHEMRVLMLSHATLPRHFMIRCRYFHAMPPSLFRRCCRRHAMSYAATLILLLTMSRVLPMPRERAGVIFAMPLELFFICLMSFSRCRHVTLRLIAASAATDARRCHDCHAPP